MNSINAALTLAQERMMRSRAEILGELNDGVSPFTEPSVIQAKTLEVILETLLDIRDLQSTLNESLVKAKPTSKRPPG
jgi:hypothetical protein